MLQDLRYAGRVLLQGKAWSAMVVLSLALGIGANTALFSATNGLLLRKLPVEDPDTLVRLRHVGRNRMANNVSEYGNIARGPGGGRRVNRVVFRVSAAAHGESDDERPGGGRAHGFGKRGRRWQCRDRNRLHRVGQLPPAAWRARRSAAARCCRRTIVPNAPPVATISSQYWTRRFGNDPAIVGKAVRANNTLVTIVGVLAPEFTGVQRVISEAPDLTFPLALDPVLNPQAAGPPNAPPRLNQPTHYWLQVIGRLKPGVTAEQVRGQSRRPVSTGRT